jgi:hypothetical protein
MTMMTFHIAVYLLAILTSLGCTVLLFRGYRRARVRLLLWSALCFVGLTISNVALFLDLVVFPDVELRPLRLAGTLIGLVFLLLGFIWDSE